MTTPMPHEVDFDVENPWTLDWNQPYEYVYGEDLFDAMAASAPITTPPENETGGMVIDPETDLELETGLWHEESASTTTDYGYPSLPTETTYFDLNNHASDLWSCNSQPPYNNEACTLWSFDDSDAYRLTSYQPFGNVRTNTDPLTDSIPGTSADSLVTPSSDPPALRRPGLHVFALPTPIGCSSAGNPPAIISYRLNSQLPMKIQSGFPFQTAETKYRCDVCGEQLSDKKNLERHKHASCSRIQTQKLICPVGECKKSLCNRTDNLRRHIRTEHPDNLEWYEIVYLPARAEARRRNQQLKAVLESVIRNVERPSSDPGSSDTERAPESSSRAPSPEAQDVVPELPVPSSESTMMDLNVSSVKDANGVPVNAGSTDLQGDYSMLSTAYQFQP